MKQITALLAILAIGISSCTHKAANNKLYGAYIIAGNAGGFVGPGATTNYYLIQNGILRADTSVLINIPPDDINNFHFDVMMPSSKYEAVQKVQSSIPSELINHNGAHIGSIIPDMGYRDVRTSINGTPYRWYFEGDQSKSSSTVQQFITSLDTLFH